MRLIHLTFLIIVMMISVSCKNNDKPIITDEKGQHFGEMISDVGAISFSELVIKMDQSDEVEAVVTGNVGSVCQAKGCWMNIVDSDGGTSEEMFVKFKDYGFFMPLDIAGKDVIMRGKAYKEETSVDELRHYAEDEGKSAEEVAAITESIIELKFMADGVILRP
ncbi:DUF4920 domain-containing protein [Saprospiraceae bacterium]|jgi:hypothetical protein|nr:DUF4920 domain-containing protein [Saprospiraceae bacterium]MDA9332699.1 DUF4920 domain-containing protein [Saprospiraceae bacterium]